MPRVFTAKKIKRGKKIKCGKCGDRIRPGSSYRFWTFYKGARNIRCMKAGCAPRQSELTRSRMSEVYAILESIEDACKVFRGDYDFDSLIGEVETQHGELESLKDDFQSGKENIPEQFQEGETAQLIEARIEAIEAYLSELDTAESEARSKWESEKPEEGDEAVCGVCGNPEEDEAHEAGGDEFDHEFEEEERLKVLAEEVAELFEQLSIDAS